jgi:hypothetical protein
MRKFVWFSRGCRRWQVKADKRWRVKCVLKVLQPKHDIAERGRVGAEEPSTKEAGRDGT